VGGLKDRRALKKARTRDHLRTVAQRMFAEGGFDAVTIADVAREADVAVQTVFNHFPTKEELFFEGRVPWVDGPAAAVRDREPGLSPLTALRVCLVETVRGLVASHSTPERRRYIATLEASETLCVQERELVHVAELRLRDALLAAWDAAPDAADTPSDPSTAAALVAAVWLSAARTLVVGQRPLLSDGACPERAAAEIMDLTDRLLGQLQSDMAAMRGRREVCRPTDTGWPPVGRRRAG
jgi:AcrR family transcriptional regulator